MRTQHAASVHVRLVLSRRALHKEDEEEEEEDEEEDSELSKDSGKIGQEHIRSRSSATMISL